ncbi:MAG TPA: GDSL-type esterase/lipase family protein [Kiritimatiellia bacterium]|mgnify:CR=1 FL=1|nr:GDSL-type esterase/lipase family protein [Kiritimatiellia bacterium]
MDASPQRPAHTAALTPAKKRAFALILILLLVGLCEWLAARILPDDLATGRLILLGHEEKQLVRMQKTIPHPYLQYIHAPNYVSEQFGPQHNEDGYRGEAVPLDRQDDVYRIVCLGGSTTYGGSVGRAHQAYPAVLDELLSTNLPEGVRDVEVINAGLTWGTSAELLTHYHFKFHYYQPDLVIINTGGNDAQAYTFPFYHPDYSNWRQPMVNLRPLAHGWRWLALSRVSSALILNIFYVDQLRGGQFVIREGAKPPAPWFKPGGNLIETPQEISPRHMAFLHNIEALIRTARAGGADVLLVPFRAAPDGYRNKPEELHQILRHERILKQLAEKHDLGFAPFPASVISRRNWTDHCHLNPAGEREKAAHIAKYVRPFIRPPRS